MAANPHEAAARTRKAIEIEQILREAGVGAELVRALPRDARELAERELHRRRQTTKPPHRRTLFTDADRASEATWAVVQTLMDDHEGGIPPSYSPSACR